MAKKAKKAAKKAVKNVEVLKPPAPKPEVPKESTIRKKIEELRLIRRDAATILEEINEKDLKVDTYRSSGAGGQHVNTTDSAVRITHIPTGIVVTCQSERSQIQNRIKAMKILRARLKELYEREQKEKLDSARRLQVGTGDRSEKIRTYNFPEGRVTDHRIKLTLYNLQEFLDGHLDQMIDALAAAEQEKKIEALSREG